MTKEQTTNKIYPPTNSWREIKGKIIRKWDNKENIVFRVGLGREQFIRLTLWKKNQNNNSTFPYLQWQLLQKMREPITFATFWITDEKEWNGHYEAKLIKFVEVNALVNLLVSVDVDDKTLVFLHDNFPQGESIKRFYNLTRPKPSPEIIPPISKQTTSENDPSLKEWDEIMKKIGGL